MAHCLRKALGKTTKDDDADASDDEKETEPTVPLLSSGFLTSRPVNTRPLLPRSLAHLMTENNVIGDNWTHLSVWPRHSRSRIVGVAQAEDLYVTASYLDRFAFQFSS